MRASILLLALITILSSSGWGQAHPAITNYLALAATTTVSSPCRRQDLSLKEGETDAAMGGVRSTNYTFTNKSQSPCTLQGYPRYELLDKAGKVRPRGRARNSSQLMGEETKQAPQLVTIEPGKEAWFRIDYNAGGAGYLGKPCPVSRRVRILAPGITKPFLLKDNIQSCNTVQVSAVRSGQPPG
jgi:hypothetical protein